MSEITTIGLDLAKHVFQVHGSMRAVGWCCASSCGAARWWRSCGARLQLDHAARGSAATDPPTSGILLRAQPLQDLANQAERAIALTGQPFLEWFRVYIEIGEEFASVQIGSDLEVRPMLRTRQAFEILQVGNNALQSTIGEIGDQMLRGTAAQRLAQLQKAVAQAVARLFRPLVGPQQVRQPLAADGLAALCRQKREQRARLLGNLPKSAVIALDH